MEPSVSNSSFRGSYRGGRNSGMYSEHDDGSGGGGGGSGGGGRGRGRGWRSRGGRRGGRRGGGGGGGRWVRGRGGGGRGGADRSQWDDNQVDDDGDFSMVDPEGQTNHARPKFDKSSSVFKRLGPAKSSPDGSGGSVFSRMSGGGGGGGSHGISRWHKVTIPGGGTQNTDWVIRQLKKEIAVDFEERNVHVMGDKLMFFIEDNRAASSLKKYGEMETRDGPLSIYVKPSPPPKGSSGGGGRGGGRGGGGGGSDGSDSGESGGVGSYHQRQRGGRGNRRGRGGVFSRVDGDISMEEDASAVVKRVLGMRYNIDLKSLDLSNMFHDQILNENHVRGSMYDPSFVATVLSLIGQHCSNLLALNLSSNRLSHLDVYSQLPSSCPSLQTLDLSDNQLRSMSELEHIQGMASLSTLVLSSNPLSQHHNDPASHSAKLRSFFPNLAMLDGEKLPSPVKFDLPLSVGQLPPVEKGYFVNEEVKRLIIAFLEEYYNMYDADSREKLLEAYSDEAVFSLSVCMPPGGSKGPSLQGYLQHSRNLARVREPGKRRSLLKSGRIDIVQFLRDLPKTKHHSPTISVDVIRASPISTAFVVHGVFSEMSGGRSAESCPVRAFTRTFIIGAAGNGVLILNDQMTIRNATQKSVQAARQYMQQQQQQQQAVLQQQTAVAAAMVAPAFQQPPPPPPPAAAQQPFQQQLVQPALSSPLAGFPAATTFSNAEEEAIRRLSQQTAMNLEWSKKCLQENGWDFNKAVMAYNILQSQQKIPADAYQ